KDSEIQKEKLERGSISYHSFHLDKDYRRFDFYQFVMAEDCIVTIENFKNLKYQTFPSEPLMNKQGFWTALNYPSVYDGFFQAPSGINKTVTVAVIDSGIDLDHKDLAGAIWTNSGEVQGNGIDDDGNGYIDDIHGYHFERGIGDPDPDDQFSAYNIHGTAVAGLIGAVENQSGIVGVMPSYVKLMSLNVFGEQGGSDVADVAEAIDYAVSNGAKIINMSLAGQSQSTVIQTALLNAVTKGVFIVVAAGNDGVDLGESTFYSPIGYAKDIDGVIGVGATIADTKQRAPYSNYNPTFVEIAAPGSLSLTGKLVGIFTLDVDDGYGYYDGTSFAAPLVAGAAALAYAYLDSHGKSPTPAGLEDLIKKSSDPIQALDGYIQQCRSLNFSNLYENLQ
ncbi:MAG: S8 family serine peptidase, partial [Bdellovibrionales bacterium]|nr:S8 family serine peptidase [Bdellovibrionales bacterium]